MSVDLSKAAASGAIVSAFAFPSPDERIDNPIEIVRTGELRDGKFTLNVDVWAIRWMGRCLNRNGEWEWEPLPSSRTDEWLAENRFTLEEALEAAPKAPRA